MDLVDDDAAVAAARAGDESAFAGLAAKYRRELQVHCYRMLASFEDAEDLTQEAFLRAWRGRETFVGRSTFRAWLYRIATNACLDFLDRNPRRPRPYQSPSHSGTYPAERPSEIPWLQPYPDALLEPVAPRQGEPDAVVVARETIELAFLAAIQHLPPRQRAVLILRDVLGWPAEQVATALEMSVAAVKSALQRARPALRERLPGRRLDWAISSEPTQDERALLHRYMAAMESADAHALAGLLSEDVRLTMPPLPMWFAGRDAITAFAAEVFTPGSSAYHGDWRLVPVHANRQPATAKYNRRPDETTYRAQSLDVLRIVGGQVLEITTFGPGFFPIFALPETLTSGSADSFSPGRPSQQTTTDERGAP
ncbi:sigma-70 family RNA polymerase sigma factor [Sphaerisporangium album]|uniref:sigma-70 family RNA polymerase sigma factor n=1 Tax=Sphaerisporangium album TaxID=509200 RepID=UPI001C69293D|nr:sigma-70 family RNA polymerase sigma factor [Sphaerisporangium album]